MNPSKKLYRFNLTITLCGITALGCAIAFAEESPVVIQHSEGPMLEAPQLVPPGNAPRRPFLRPADDQPRERVQASQSLLQNEMPPASQQVPPLPPPTRPQEMQTLPNAPVQHPFLRSTGPSNNETDNRYRSADGVFNSGAMLQEPIPQPLGDIQVRPTPPIKYDTDRGARRMYRDSGAVDVLMLVQNPADGCYYEIPLCIPACCAGEAPSMECDEGIFGRGKVKYCWPCGFEAEIKFRHVLGDVKVEYDA